MMNLKDIAQLILAAAVLSPAAFAAPAQSACSAGQPGPASEKWNFQQEASQLLDRIQVDAARANAHADQLSTFADDTNVSWETHTEEMAAVRSEVNEMGQKLCRLEQIRRVTAPWQQKAIDRTYPLVKLMADNTDEALRFLNHNQLDLWRPVYRKYAENLWRESSTLARLVKEFEEYANALNQDKALGHSLGI